MTPPKAKRQKLDASVASTSPERKTKESAASSSTKLASRDNFALLPDELQDFIVRLACSLPVTSSSSTTPATSRSSLSPADTTSAPAATPSTASLGQDISTTLILVRVSRSMYALVTPLIWSHVRINRPSQLVAFKKALCSRPQLGRVIKSLHVGPDDPLPRWYYPIIEHDPAYDSDSSVITTDYYTDFRITSSLRGALALALLPRGSWREEGYLLNFPAYYDCRSAAISDALEALQAGLDVNLCSPGYTWKCKAHVAGAEWLVRMFEAQAALDLYLMAVRRIEDEEERREFRLVPRFCDCPRRKCPVDPALCLQWTSQLSEQDRRPRLPHAPPIVLNGPKLVITRSQLLQHLARARSITDRFDHPLLFARSGIDLVNRGSKHDSERMDCRYRTFEEGQEDPSRLLRLAPDLDEYPRRLVPHPVDINARDPFLPSTATMESILTIVRSIFPFTPLLANLSLTGFLESAICGAAAPSLRRLRHLSLGPPPPAWFSPLDLFHVNTVQSLRICGVELRSSEAIDIAHCLRSLRHFQLSMAAEWDPWVSERTDASTLSEIVAMLRDDETLLNSFDREDLRLWRPIWKEPKSDLDEEEGKDGGQGREEGKGEDDETSFDDSSLPLYELRLHPNDVKSLLDSAPSQAVRAAWQSGKALSREEHCRLLLVESAAAEGWWEGVSCTTVGELYAEGREWWERCAGLRGGARRAQMS